MPRVLNYRTDGLPAGAVYIGRANPYYGLPASKWANPYREGRDGNRLDVISACSDYIIAQLDWGKLDIAELKGKDLVCWCSPLPCHGDLLLALANKGN